MNKELLEKDVIALNSKKGLMNLLRPEQPIFKTAVRRVKYEKDMESLQAAMIQMQNWVIFNNKRVVILFEGRDAAGKGGAIRRCSEHLNPRSMRIVALPKPTEIERGQWYFQRYVRQLPGPGEIVFFDRSWYNRAVVEPVNGFCTKDEYERFMSEVSLFEDMLVNDGIILLKFYFSISKVEQKDRFERIKKDPLKVWKMSPVDEHAQELWDEYTKYKLQMLERTDTNNSPWYIIKADRKTKARIECIEKVLNAIPGRLHVDGSELTS